MEVFKKPPVLEDTVFFCIYYSLTNGETGDAEKVQRLQKELHRLRTECLSVVSPLVAGYIWQHETFDLKVTSSKCHCFVPFDHIIEEEEVEDAHAGAIGSSICAVNSSISHLHGELNDISRDTPSYNNGKHDDLLLNTHVNLDDSTPWHLQGKLKYGDNIEDEWFVVSLLFAISRQFSELCIRVWDTDGEFLLIEAAYSIPRWLKPENSWNRVFIKGDSLHIIPLPSSPAEIYQLPLLPSVTQSLELLRSGNFATRATENVQQAIRRRLEAFGPNSKNNMHDVICRVPLPIAQILKHEPQLVALAVSSFYDRDLDSMKVASQMRHFLPIEKEVQMVDVLVRMSRAMYGQLIQQVFQAPRRYPMPLPSDSHYAEAELGMKLTCGFEMMYWERSPSSSEVHNQKDIGWNAFLASLQKTGYFRDLLEGSKEYRELLDNAKESYRKSSLFAKVSAAMNAPVQRIAEIMALPHSMDDFPRSLEVKSDDDSWLYGGEKDLNTAMQERQREIDMYESERACRASLKKTQQKGSRKKKRTKGDFAAEEVAKSMHDFINKISSYEGAELPSDGVEPQGNDEPITIRMESFLKELESAVGINAADVRWNSETSSDEMGMYSSDEADHDDSENDTSEMEEEMDEAIPSTSSSVQARKKQTSDGDKKSKTAFMEEYSEALDKELNSSSLGKSFVRSQTGQGTGDKVKGFDEDMEELPPVNIDINLLQNLLQSYSSQHGLPGPASNLLGAMGLELPDDHKDME